MCHSYPHDPLFKRLFAPMCARGSSFATTPSLHHSIWLVVLLPSSLLDPIPSCHRICLLRISRPRDAASLRLLRSMIRLFSRFARSGALITATWCITHQIRFLPVSLRAPGRQILWHAGQRLCLQEAPVRSTVLGATQRHPASFLPPRANIKQFAFPNFHGFGGQEYARGTEQFGRRPSG